ncbi:uncharacterized protein A4U43_C03F9120 [Asparagus officinalis]|uniref:Receptor-like serine/threonine-protein kinase n=1 Tax=Asparagus officinalis TaxID=4686 RepID=A0A5P1F8I1_ASPOF|nr:uncharacterized protein A4U43_C03F9120 [Asparagus officinalis]
MEPIVLLLFLLLLLLSFSTARDTITPSNPLADNETLVSATGTFALGFFNPPNSDNRYIGLWYNQISDHTILWVANRASPLVNSTGVLSVTKDGRLTITSQNSTVVWTSPNSTVELTSPIAQLLENGNLVVMQDGDTSGNYGWQGFNYLTDTLIPGMKLGVDLTTGINRTLVAWASENDPSPGPYHGFMDIRGDPDIYFCRDSTPIWRSGAWDGTHLSGIPDMSTYRGFQFNFVNNASEVVYFYSVINRSYISRLLVNSTGFAQRALWLPDANQWNFFWNAPKDLCDDIGQCGPYGLCDANDSPLCSCLQGFDPKNPSNWNLRDGHDGCKRRTPLDCKNGTDGFVTVSNVKLPQSDNCTVDMNLNLDQCRRLCLGNCSCTAYASANVSGGGSGCIIWIGNLFDIRNFVGSGQDLYVRLAAADLDVSSGKTQSTIVAVAVSLVAAALLLTCVGCFLWRRKKKRRVLLGAMTSFNEKSNHEPGDLDLPIFDFATIAASIDYFSDENKLGEGGFGPVYKGTLEDNQEIAVKRLAKTSIQGLEEFKNEIVLIAKLQHRNLVRLLGCCIQGEERMLIYEYMPNRSLDAFLFEKERAALLDWKMRHQIIVGIARGLLYLHQDSRFRIIHRDLKASNILLDEDMNPKISDFGMARIFGGDETDFNTRKVVGTGYMSPEYAMDGIFSVKSDVFSFGVLVLEIISGKKNRGVYAIPPHINLVAHAWSLWKEGKSLQLVDESMGYSFPTNEALRCIKLGLLCVQEHPEDRPLMSSVVLMLGSDLASLPQPKQPGFAARRGPFEVDTSSSNQDSCTLNEISVSMFQPR